MAKAEAKTSGGFGVGFVSGSFVSVLGLAALSVAMPLSERSPLQFATPESPTFNTDFEAADAPLTRTEPETQGTQIALAPVANETPSAAPFRRMREITPTNTTQPSGPDVGTPQTASARVSGTSNPERIRIDRSAPAATLNATVGQDETGVSLTATANPQTRPRLSIARRPTGPASDDVLPSLGVSPGGTGGPRADEAGLVPTPQTSPRETEVASLSDAPLPGVNAPSTAPSVGAPSGLGAGAGFGAPASPSAGPAVETAALAPTQQPQQRLSFNRDQGGSGFSSLSRDPSTPDQPSFRVLNPQANGGERPTIEQQFAALPDAEAAVPDAPLLDVQPWRLHSAAFLDTGDKPLLSVILQDVGEKGIDVSALSGLQFPVTFAVPVDLPDATERAKAYRAAGFEVMAMVPAGPMGDLSNLEGSALKAQLSSFMTEVPEAIGLIDRVDGDIPRDNRLSRAVIEFVAESGHALLAHQSVGIGGLVDLAQRDEIPAAMVERVLYADAGGAELISSLDRGALSARTDGTAVVLGTTEATTLTTLFSWVLNNGPRDVDLAPVSAALNRDRDAS
ncbi:MAG: divergent polysaccharide deacetylase family protein [Pseudomonadota bacterium]